MSDPSAALADDSVDPAVLDGLRAFGGMPLLTQLVALYREQVRIRLAAMDAALQTADAEALRQAAHALKGSSGQVGATGLQHLCGRIEHCAAAHDLQDIPLLRAAVQHAAAGVDQWLVDHGFPH